MQLICHICLQTLLKIRKKKKYVAPLDFNCRSHTSDIVHEYNMCPNKLILYILNFFLFIKFIKKYYILKKDYFII